MLSCSSWASRLRSSEIAISFSRAARRWLSSAMPRCCPIVSSIWRCAGRELARLREVEVEHAELLIAEADGKHADGGEADACATVAFLARNVAPERVHAAALPLGGLAAQAFAALEATLGRDEVGWQRLLHVEVQPAALGLDQAHGAGARAQPRAQLPEELAAQLLCAAGFGEQGGDLVEGGQLFVLVRKRAGLVGDPAFQGAVQIRQVPRHAVETGRQGPELVLCFHRQAHVEIAGLHPAACRPRAG